MSTYTTNFRRLCLGLLFGLLVETLMLAPLAYFFYFDPDNIDFNPNNFDSIGGLISVSVWCAAWIGRYEGLLASAFGLGGIVWLMLSRAGRRSWPYSVSLGFAASFICGFSWFAATAAMKAGGGLPGFETIVTVVVVASAILGLIGAVGWWVTWRIAYRRAETT